jgi:general secretion pathway protein H
MLSAGKGSVEKSRLSNGFTLIELVVVLFILGLLTVLTLPAFSRSLKGLKLRKAVQEMTSVMRHARGQAIYEQIPKWVEIDVEGNRYRSGDGLVEERLRRQDKVVRAYSIPPEVVIKEFRWLNGSKEPETGWVQFYPNGSASGGSVLIAGIDVDTSASIVVEPFTGLVNMELGGAGER